MVPSSQYEAACSDLQRATQREREAQAALTQLSTTAQQLHAKYVALYHIASLLIPQVIVKCSTSSGYSWF